MFVAVALLFGVLRGGARYFYCPEMDATLASPCCERGKHEGEDERPDATNAPSVDDADCCEARRAGTLPAVDGASTTPRLEAVPLLAILPPFDRVQASRERAAESRVVHPARAGPPSAAERRAFLMVWNS